MFDLLVETFGGVELDAAVHPALAAPAEVEVVSARPDRIELRVPVDLTAIPAAEKVLASSLGDIPAEARESVAAAFHETLENAVEHGCRLDRSKSVEVSYVRLRRAVVCRIKDPGAGFDPTRLEHAAINNIEDDPVRHVRVREEMGMRAGGYGLLLARRLVDVLHYNERHNEVLLVKYLP